MTFLHPIYSKSPDVESARWWAAKLRVVGVERDAWMMIGAAARARGNRWVPLEAKP